MKFSARLRFFLGILFTILLVFGLTVYLNSTMSRAYSIKAALDSEASTVGTSYAGVIAEQNVEEGERVKKGDTLFEIDSSALKQDLANNRVSTSSLPFSVAPGTNNIILKANSDGTVKEIFYPSGSFVPVGAVIASINTTDSLYVTAHFTLSPPDYVRIDRNNELPVRLPDNSVVNAKIFDVSLINNDELGGVDTVVKARIQDASLDDFRFSVGTPVKATLHLKQDTWYQGLFTYIQDLFVPDGK